ncbi:Trehalose-6-P synthase/phosphatase complex subunit [Nowakowskiella sp. JEL0078]|nr:Trehalose-6-P synthase/phosphatase complex subunit [Nowakowskiella sp. JEL0078]
MFFPVFPPLPSTRGRVLVVSLFLPNTLDIHVPANSKQRSAASSPQGDPQYWNIEPSSMGNVGLQNAVNSVAHRISRRLWIGTLGTATESFSEDFKFRLQEKMLGEFDSVTVFLTDEESDGHYHQFCKQVLWRPFHYQISDYPKSKAYEERSWRHYVAVNQKFASIIASVHQPGDVVWINDYHLMLVPAMVRQLIPTAMIGFFLHIPFPSSEIFRCLHVRKQILEGMLGADLIGFQTYSFMRHFLMTCTRLLALESTPKGIQLDNTVVSVGIFPIGINLVTLNERRNNPEANEIIASLKERYSGKAIVIGRDKNDAIKGVRQKMLSFERFLITHPEWLGRVVLIQVALSTSEANENESNVSDVVARINSKFGTIEYTPVFAGTYGSFGAALRVNPWDTQEVADAIYDALTMSEEDKLYRWNELYNYITTTNTAQAWVDSFVNEVTKVHETLQHSIASSIPPLPFTMVQHEYSVSSKRILFLDHDGTLVPVGSPLANNIYEVLMHLSADPKNIVYLMSGRTKDSLDVFGGIPNVGICAENGCFIKFAGKNKWETMLPETDLSWKKKVLEIFDRTPGSFIEQKECSVAWHYGLADLNFVSWQAAECQNHIEQSLSPIYPIHALAKRKRVEVMPTNANKGIMIRKILDFHQLTSTQSRGRTHEYTTHNAIPEISQNAQFDFILAIGDDRADEYMFEYLSRLDVMATTVSIKDDTSVDDSSLENEDESERDSLAVGQKDFIDSRSPSPYTNTMIFRRVIITCTVGRKSSAAYWHVSNVAEIKRLLEGLMEISVEDGVQVQLSSMKLKPSLVTVTGNGSEM